MTDTGRRQVARFGGARPRSIYCTLDERAVLRRRASRAGMNLSRFLIACALKGGRETATGEPRLVMTEAEQRSLVQQSALLDQCCQALLEQLPGTGMSVLGALAFLAEEARASSGAGREDSK